MSRATDALHETIRYGWVCCKPPVPGVVVLSRPQAVRDDLKELKSHEIANVRDDLAFFISDRDREQYQKHKRRYAK